MVRNLILYSVEKKQQMPHLDRVALMLAEELGTSVITNITEIALDGDKVTAKQETEEGYRTSRSFCTMCCNSHKTRI